MTGSTMALITPIVVVIALVAPIAMVLYADAHLAWRRQARSGQDMAGRPGSTGSGGRRYGVG